MIETIIATILGDAAVVGCITGIVYFLGEKIFSLLYDAAKEKISIDIGTKDKTFRITARKGFVCYKSSI